MLLTVFSMKNFLWPGDACSTTFTCSVRTATWRDTFPHYTAVFTRQLMTATRTTNTVPFLSGPIAGFCDEGYICRMPIALDLVWGRGWPQSCTAQCKHSYVKLQDRPKVDIQSVLHYIQYAYFWPTFYFFGLSNKHKNPLLYAKISLPQTILV